jgi:uncharacterized membrane protein
MTRPCFPPAAGLTISILLSHHRADEAHRTLALSFAGSEVRLCTRCTGILVGGIAFLLISGLYRSLGTATTAFQISQVPFALAPLPASYDWARQTRLGAETDTPRRFGSGILLGLALTDVLYLAYAGLDSELVVAGIVATAYVLTIGLVGSRPSG